MTEDDNQTATNACPRCRADHAITPLHEAIRAALGEVIDPGDNTITEQHPDPETFHEVIDRRVDLRFVCADAVIERVALAASGPGLDQGDPETVAVRKADLVAYLNRGGGDLFAEVDALNRLLAAVGLTEPSDGR